MTTETPRLPLDDDTEALLRIVRDVDEEAVQGAIIDLREDHGTERYRMGLARALARLQAESDRLSVAAMTVVDEARRLREGLLPSIAWLEQQMAAEALAHREAGHGNHLDIPGVGRWLTRKGRAGWVVPSGTDERKAIIDYYRDDADLFRSLVRQVEALDTGALRGYLDDMEMADRTDMQLPPGVERRDPEISVTYDLNEGGVK